MQLPRLLEAVAELQADFRQRHFVEFHPDFEAFLRGLKSALYRHQLPQRVLWEVFGQTNLTVHPPCHG